SCFFILLITLFRINFIFLLNVTKKLQKKKQIYFLLLEFRFFSFCSFFFSFSFNAIFFIKSNSFSLLFIILGNAFNKRLGYFRTCLILFFKIASNIPGILANFSFFKFSTTIKRFLKL